MKNNMERIGVVLFRFILAAVFIYAGVLKIMNPAEFAAQIENYQMLPYILVTLMAIILPWIEVICGVLLVVGAWLKPASLLILLMNIIFVIAITAAILRGLDISCGCFSLHSTQVGLHKIVEDLVYAAMALYILLKARKPSVDHHP